VLPFFSLSPLALVCLLRSLWQYSVPTHNARTQNHPQLRLLDKCGPKNSHKFDIISPITGRLFALMQNPDRPARMLGDFRTDSTGTQGTRLPRLLVSEVNTCRIGAIERFDILIRLPFSLLACNMTDLPRRVHPSSVQWEETSGFSQGQVICIL